MVSRIRGAGFDGSWDENEEGGQTRVSVLVEEDPAGTVVCNAPFGSVRTAIELLILHSSSK